MSSRGKIKKELKEYAMIQKAVVDSIMEVLDNYGKEKDC